MTSGRYWGYARVCRRDESGFDYAPTIGYHELNAAAGNFAAVFGLGDPQRIAQEVAASNQRAKQLRSIQPDYVGEFNRAMVTHGGDLNKAFDAFMASQEDNGRSEIRKALDSFKTGGATLGEVLSMIGAAASRPRGLVYQTAESVPAIAPV
jgi:hypothetical protein